MRTFSYSDATSHKFWTIERDGKQVTVRYGREGSAGQTQVKSFSSEEAAQKEHDKLIQEKVKKGYRETTPPAAGSNEALLRSLEQSILDNPDDLTAHAAYADLLMESNDPDEVARGEFIQVQLGLEDESRSPQERKQLRKREKNLLKKYQKQWVGDWAELAPVTGTEGRGQVIFPAKEPFRFIRGILAEVTFCDLSLVCARAFIQSPQTRLVRGMYLGDYAYEEEETEPEDSEDEDEDDNQAFPSQRVLPRWPHFENLRVFQFGWTSDEDYKERCDFQCHLVGDNVVDLIRRMPRLEELYLFCFRVPAAKLFGLETLTNLRVLQMYHNWQYPLERLAGNPAFSRLTHLLLHPKANGGWADAPYIKLRGVRAVLRSPHLQNLTHLRLRLTDIVDRGCKEIVQSGILKRLKLLDLRHGCVSDEGARILAGCPDLRN